MKKECRTIMKVSRMSDQIPQAIEILKKAISRKHPCDESHKALKTIEEFCSAMLEAAPVPPDHIPDAGQMVELEAIEQDITKCHNCGGLADNGHDRCYPFNPYYCTKCQAPEDALHDIDDGDNAWFHDSDMGAR